MLANCQRDLTAEQAAQKLRDERIYKKDILKWLKSEIWMHKHKTKILRNPKLRTSVVDPDPYPD